MKTKNEKTLKMLMTVALNSLSMLAFSQDTLQLRNGTNVLSKIMEISAVEIKYKRTENADGPLYIASRDDVKAIRYKNGFVDSFPEIKPWFKPVTKNENQVTDNAVARNFNKEKIEKHGRFYMVDNSRVSEKEVQSIMKEPNNTEINLHIKKAVLAKALQPICFLGIPSAAIGFTALALSDLESMEGSTNNSNKTKNIGIGLVVLSAACLTTSIVLKSHRQKHNAIAMRLYNQTIK